MKNKKTLVNRIIELNSKKKNVVINELIEVDIDHIYIQDGNSPTISELYKKYKLKKVFNNKKISFFFDHSVLSNNIKISNQIDKAFKFAKKIKANIFTRGEGISHILAIEKKIFKPFKIVLGSDSHTCTGGVYFCLSLGMGASDILYSMITGKTWLKVPETINIIFLGIPHNSVRTKDIMLYILKKYEQNLFLYKSIEISGEWIKNLSLSSAITIANMGVELGCKCIFTDHKENKYKYITKNNSKHNLFIDINKLIPQISKPHYPNNVTNFNKLSGKKINYVFIGSCANSCLNDIAEVSEILKNRKIHKDIHCIVIPGSKNILLKSIKYGYIENLIKSGVLISPPGCGPCVGTQGTIPSNNSNILSTMNRNFKGRMGNSNAKIYISSPLIAAYTAYLGYIPYLEDLING